MSLEQAAIVGLIDYAFYRVVRMFILFRIVSDYRLVLSRAEAE